MQGMAVGRAVDLMRFTTYDELYAKLEEMFGLDDKNISDKGTSAWEVFFTDEEDDIMVVGDDPWRYANFKCYFWNICYDSTKSKSKCLLCPYKLCNVFKDL